MLEVTLIKDITVAKIINTNRLNALIYQAVKDKLNEIVRSENAKLILNLEGIDFIDSSGFSSLISIYKTSRINNSHFKLCNISPEVMELIELMKLQKILDICTDIDSCTKSF